MSTAEGTRKETMARHRFTAQAIEHGKARSVEGLAPWWADFRRSAQQRLVSLDVPGPKDEEWRFIKLGPIVDAEYVMDSQAAVEIDEAVIEKRRIPEARGATLVFSNGRFQPELSNTQSLPEGVRLTTWSQVAAEGGADELEEYVGIADYWEDDVFYNANGANFDDGAVLVVPRNQVVETPIHLLYVGSGEAGEYAAHPRNVIVAGESSECTVIEEYATFDGGTYFHNVVDEVSVGANATVRHVKVQRDSTNARHMARNLVTLSQDSVYEATAVNLGAELSRNDSYARFDGTNVECTLDGLVYIDGRQVHDTHTAMDHALPDSKSYQLQKTIVDDRAHSVFNGKIFVRQDAQRIDSNQLNQNLLLSRRAQVDTKPQLEIFADDVVCSHGATVGQLQDDQLFYLLSRGMEEENARSLLTYAFAAEILEDIQVDSLRQRLESMLMRQARK